MAMAASSRPPPPGDAPYFAFEGDIKPAPQTPKFCRGECGTELEPLRRTGGYCKACITKRSKPAPPPTDALRTTMKVVRMLWRRVGKYRERYVEVRCKCGTRRVMRWSEWIHEQPACCHKCRLRGIDQNGFEAERLR